MIQDKENVVIIIPTHNNVTTIKRALESVTKGIRPANKVVVGDNDSDDGTYELLCKLLGAKPVEMDGKTGLPPQFDGELNGTPVKIFRKKLTTTGHTLNVALQMNCDGVSIFGFMDPKSYYSFDKISQAINVFVHHQSVACVVSDCDNHYSDGRVERVFRPSFDLQKLLTSFPYDSNFLVRTTVFPKLKRGFDEQMQAREDYEFLLRACEIGLIYHIPAPLHHNTVAEIEPNTMVGLSAPDAIAQCEDHARRLAIQRRNPQGG
jgi:hypothetical protein